MVKMNVIKTIKDAALGALVYAAAAISGCKAMPMYDFGDEIGIIRFENKGEFTDSCQEKVQY